MPVTIEHSGDGAGVRVKAYAQTEFFVSREKLEAHEDDVFGYIADRALLALIREIMCPPERREECSEK